MCTAEPPLRGTLTTTSSAPPLADSEPAHCAGEGSLPAPPKKKMKLGALQVEEAQARPRAHSGCRRSSPEHAKQPLKWPPPSHPQVWPEQGGTLVEASNPLLGPAKVLSTTAYGGQGGAVWAMTRCAPLLDHGRARARARRLLRLQRSLQQGPLERAKHQQSAIVNHLPAHTRPPARPQVMLPSVLHSKPPPPPKRKIGGGTPGSVLPSVRSPASGCRGGWLPPGPFGDAAYRPRTFAPADAPASSLCYSTCADVAGTDTDTKMCAPYTLVDLVGRKVDGVATSVLPSGGFLKRSSAAAYCNNGASCTAGEVKGCTDYDIRNNAGQPRNDPYAGINAWQWTQCVVQYVRINGETHYPGYTPANQDIWVDVLYSAKLWKRAAPATQANCPAGTALGYDSWCWGCDLGGLLKFSDDNGYYCESPDPPPPSPPSPPPPLPPRRRPGPRRRRRPRPPAHPAHCPPAAPQAQPPAPPRPCPPRGRRFPAYGRGRRGPPGLVPSRPFQRLGLWAHAHHHP